MREPGLSPQVKKKLRLTRDTRTEAEYPHAFRKNWPRKRTAAQRAHRRAVKQVLSGSDHDAAQSTAESLRRTEAKKRPGSSVRLQEHIRAAAQARPLLGTRPKP